MLSRYSEALQYSGAFNSSWEYSNGAVMGFAISDPPSTGDNLWEWTVLDLGAKQTSTDLAYKKSHGKSKKFFWTWQTPALWFVFSHSLSIFSSKHISSKESGLFSPGERIYSRLTNWFYSATVRKQNSYWLNLKQKQVPNSEHHNNHKCLVSHSTPFLLFLLRHRGTVSLFFFWRKWLHLGFIVPLL